jgi:molybdenum cofactor biosynthesis enzyme MoaA
VNIQPGSDHYPPLKVLVFPITYRCNARCIMCSIGGMKWIDRPPSFFEPFFASPLTDSLESINITGGEPTLREDLSTLVNMIVAHSPRLSEILINTNGLRPSVVEARIRTVLQQVPRRLKVWVFVSLDALDDSAEQVRGFRDANTLARESVERLKQLRSFPNFAIAISCTVTRVNCHALEEVRRFARENELYVDFPFATVNTTYINSASKAPLFVTSKSQNERIGEFYLKLSSEPPSAAALLYYSRMGQFLTTGKLNHADCVYRSGAGLLLEPDGKVRVCGMSDDSLIGDMSHESVAEILRRRRPNMWKHCATCTTNSYASWTSDAQKLAKKAMFENLKARRASARAMREPRGAL